MMKAECLLRTGQPGLVLWFLRLGNELLEIIQKNNGYG